MSNGLRILHVVHQYLPEYIGGTELYTKWLAEALNTREVETAVFYRRSQPGVGLSQRTDGNIPVWSSWYGEVTAISRFVASFEASPIVNAFERVLDTFQPTIVHGQHMMGLPAILFNCLQQRGIPYIITLHDYWWLCANAQLLTNYDETTCNGPKAYLNCARCALARADRPNLWLAIPLLAAPLARRNHLLRQVLNSAARLISFTQFVRDWHIQHGIAADKIQIVTPGLNVPILAERQYWQGKRPLRIGYVGGLSTQKGIHLLVQAFTHLTQPAELWLAGDMTANAAYVAHIQKLANEQVRFMGKLSRAEVWHMLRQVDVIVVPSLWYETYCFVISEAFAASVPVITFNLGVLAERVRHQVDGLVLPPGDVKALTQTLAALQKDPAQLAHLRQGIEPPLPYQKHVDHMITIYKQVAASHINKKA